MFVAGRRAKRKHRAKPKGLSRCPHSRKTASAISKRHWAISCFAARTEEKPVSYTHLGFTISTEACTQYYNDGRQINEEIMADIYEYIGKLEEIAGKKFGDVNNPLLVSVRSGARASMPGMMDTILNLGLNDEAVEGLAKLTNNPRFAYDSYRRFVQMFSDVVMEMSKSDFEQIIDEMKEAKGVTQDVELDADDMKALVVKFKALYKEKMGKDFPSDPKEQLIEAVKAVFRSWDNPRANVYRRMNEIPYDWGTAVNVQCMAFGLSLIHI